MKLPPALSSAPASVFSSLSIPIWILDLSPLAAKLHARTDAASYPHPDELHTALLTAPVVLAVNQAAVAYHGARSERELLGSLDRIFLPSTMDAFADALIALRRGSHSEAEIFLGHLHDARSRVRARFDRMADADERLIVSMSLLSVPRHSNLLDVIPDLLFEINAGGICVDFAGPKDDPLFDSRDFLGKSLTEALPADVAHRLLAALQRLRRHGGTERLEYALSMSDGLHWFDARMVALPFGGATAYVRDVTDRKSAEWRLQESQAELDARVRARTLELEYANREMTAFNYSVAHDLRAPLRAIRGFSDIVLERSDAGLDTENVHCLERIRAAAKQMDRLIDDLLRLSQVSRRELERTSVDVSQLAIDIVNGLRATQPERQVRIHVQPDIRATGDPGLLRIVFENLIGNAWKFTSATASPEVTVSATVCKRTTIACVRDNGAGFDMRHADRLFGAFQRLHAHDEFEGTGIGLAIAHRIVERHNARIWTEAAVGKGAAFFIELESA